MFDFGSVASETIIRSLWDISEDNIYYKSLILKTFFCSDILGFFLFLCHVDIFANIVIEYEISSTGFVDELEIVVIERTIFN